MLWDTAIKNGLRGILSSNEAAVEDDHVPFLDAGIPCVDIIDLNYPPWHTEGDTLDKLSTASMEKVGSLVLKFLSVLQRRFALAR